MKALKQNQANVFSTPSIGQYVYDTYYNVKRQVKAISGELYFIGSDHEPLRRHEFIFPLPRN